MLEKPNLADEKIINCLHDAYGLTVVEIAFLPLGADINTAVYRATAEKPLEESVFAGARHASPLQEHPPFQTTSDRSARYFVKLRSGWFDETTVIIPKLLHEQGVSQIIAPLSTTAGALWANLDDFKVTVSPFVEGRDGYMVDLSDEHWIDFGRALKSVHTAVIPPAVKNRIPRETFSPQWREIVKGFQKQVEETTFADSTAATLAAFLRGKEDEISRLVKRAEVLAATLQRQSLPFIVCHGDIHAGNIFIDTTQKLYIVDWDTLILAPKERDLMFVGGGQFGSKRTAQAEETLFYRGYGQTEADAVALAYYRYERIVQDIAAYCEQILLNDERDEDRKEGLRQLTSQFLPDGVITAAWESEKRLKNPTR